MLKIIATLLLLLAYSFTLTAQKAAQKKLWVSLFNGKDLTGWDIKIAGQKINDNYKNTFRVENGMLRIAYDQYQKFDDKFGHLYFNKPYSWYILKFQYRFTGEQTPGGASWNVRNSGVMIHSQSAESVNLRQDFPISVEVQLLGGLGKGPRTTGNVCTPGTQVHINHQLSQQHCVNSNSKTYDGDQWVNMTVVVLGDSIVHQIVETDTVLTYTKTEVGGGFVNKDYDFKRAGIDDPDYWLARQNTPLTTGYIALQAESHPIDFRKIKLLDLEGCMDKKAKNYKTYYLKADNSKCKW
jgi:hypothetical protein